MSDQEQMRSFWNAKAEDNPLWYIASDLEYWSVDEKRFWESGEEEVAKALAAAGITGGKTAVDIGCGVGRLSRALSSRFEKVYSFDVSTKMVELGRRAMEPLGNVAVSATPGDGTLDVPDASVDLVLSLQVFQHIPSRDITLRYFREAGRILSPGGTFAFQVRSLRMADPVRGRAERAVRGVVDRVRRMRRPPPAALDSPAWHGSRVGLWEIRAACAQAGLVVDSTSWLLVRGASLFGVARKR